MNNDLPDRARFEEAYRGVAPWDTGRPQPALVAAAEQLHGSILDAGCGTGENALYFATRGHAVTGIDFLEEPIRRARQKAAERDVPATFLVIDALALEEIPQQFDAVIDCGLFHVFSDDDRRRYIAGLTGVLRAGGRVFLMCFSDAEPGTDGPRRVSQAELRKSFGEAWEFESITATRFAIVPDLPDLKFSEGGPHAWLAVVSLKNV